MAYDEELADRVRECVLDQAGGPGQSVALELTEKRMFGGYAFLVNGNLAVAASGQGGLLLRVDPEQTAAMLTEPLTGRFVMHGREMNGWLRIDVDAGVPADVLEEWVSRGVGYASSLPPK